MYKLEDARLCTRKMKDYVGKRRDVRWRTNKRRWKVCTRCELMCKNYFCVQKEQMWNTMCKKDYMWNNVQEWTEDVRLLLWKKVSVRRAEETWDSYEEAVWKDREECL